MEIVEILPICAALIFMIVAVINMSRDGKPKHDWQIAAIFSALFLAWSLAAILYEGPTGFWPEHVRNMWGNQIWFDLLLAVGVAWFLVLPRAKAVNMRLPLWLLFIICTGSIGLTALLARLLYLEKA